MRSLHDMNGGMLLKWCPSFWLRAAADAADSFWIGKFTIMIAIDMSSKVCRIGHIVYNQGMRWCTKQWYQTPSVSRGHTFINTLSRRKTSRFIFRNSVLYLHIYARQWTGFTLRWRHNGRDSVPNRQPRDCLHNRLFRRRSKKTPKLRVNGFCVGNSPGTGESPAQMASNAENVSIWWRHHEITFLDLFGAKEGPNLVTWPNGGLL